MAYKQRGNPILTVRLPQQLIDRLKAIADDTGSTVSEIIRLGIELAISGYSEDKGKPQ